MAAALRVGAQWRRPRLGVWSSRDSFWWKGLCLRMPCMAALLLGVQDMQHGVKEHSWMEWSQQLGLLCAEG